MAERFEALGRAIDALVAEGHVQEAEAELARALKAQPSDPELSRMLGTLLCLTQREIEAAALLKVASPTPAFGEFGQMVVDYFACRALMAKRLGVRDDLGKKWLGKCVRDHGLQPGKVGISLTACLIVKNEEKNLERCLSSLKGLVDEIVVVDTGSCDRTVALAEGHGALIGQFAWIDDFAAARNEALKLATGDWVLWIDADEEVAEGSEAMIREGLMRPQFGGYFLRIVNFMRDEGQTDQYVHTPLRLFRNVPGVCFTGRIHEQVLPSLKNLGLRTATIQGARLNHYGYSPSAMEEKNKLHRTITLLEREVKDFPNEPFHWFNLANAYVTAGRPKDAIRAAKASIERLPADAPYGSLTYHLLCGALIDTGRAEEAIQRCIEAEQRGFGGILVEFEKVRAIAELKQYQEALDAMDRCLTLGWPEGLSGDYGIFTHKRWILKGQILALMGRDCEALDCFDRALRVDPDCPAALYGRGTMLARGEEPAAALEPLERCFTDRHEGRRAMRVAIQVHLATGQPEAGSDLAHKLWEGGEQDPALLMLWSTASERAGDFDDILKAYEKLEREGDMGSELLVNWGRALHGTGRSIEALECFERALESSPDDANAHFNQADALYALGRFVQAAEAYQAGLQIDGTNHQAWFALGNSLYRMELNEGARTCYEQVLNSAPDHAEARANLALLDEAA